MPEKLSEEELRKAKEPYVVSMYVHYDDNGYVTAISNSKSISDKYYEVPFNRVETFLSGKRSFSGLTYEYFKYDSLTVDEDKRKIRSNLLYKIPEASKNSCDFKLIIKKNLNQVSFVLTDESKKEIYSRNLDDRYKFYFTKKDNYNFLYGSIAVSGKSLLSGSYLELPFFKNDFSIYTMPIFNSYGVTIK